MVKCAPSTTHAPKRLWFVQNPGSHSVDPEVVESIRARVAERGGDLVGETDFPENAMPDAAFLEERQVDTLITLGGDGTITCAATELAGWGGRLLVLAGGTMNLIPKMLHPDLDPEAIVDAAFDRPRLTALPYVAVGDHRSFARIIAGPAASFVHVREEIRAGRLKRMWRALRFAWTMLWTRSIALDGQAGRLRAIFIRPGPDDRLCLEPIPAAGPWSAIKLAWTWTADLFGDHQVLGQEHDGTATVRSTQPVRMLLDGEELILDPPVELKPGKSGLCFFTGNEGDAIDDHEEVT